jgi:5-methyltetrahydrofolate--homocysteine methyltransferase
MRETVKQVRATGVPAKIVIGGAPVTPEYAREIGADGYAPDAGSAVDTAMALLARS